MQRQCGVGISAVIRSANRDGYEMASRASDVSVNVQAMDDQTTAAIDTVRHPCRTVCQRKMAVHRYI